MVFMGVSPFPQLNCGLLALAGAERGYGKAPRGALPQTLVEAA
jgi:hypothetical protein